MWVWMSVLIGAGASSDAWPPVVLNALARISLCHLLPCVGHLSCISRLMSCASIYWPNLWLGLFSFILMIASIPFLILLMVPSVPVIPVLLRRLNIIVGEENVSSVLNNIIVRLFQEWIWLACVACKACCCCDDHPTGSRFFDLFCIIMLRVSFVPRACLIIDAEVEAVIDRWRLYIWHITRVIHLQANLLCNGWLMLHLLCFSHWTSFVCCCIQVVSCRRLIYNIPVCCWAGTTARTCLVYRPKS